MPRPKKDYKLPSPQKKRGRRPKAASAPLAAKPEAAVKRKIETPEVLKGFKDILPVDAPLWRNVMQKGIALADVYGFKFIETPILEYQALYKRGLGKASDIVEKEMFEFIDKGGEAVALRPEGTAGVARAYINHGMQNMPQPVKLFYHGPMFRYENPQAGRLRAHHQIGFEIFGSSSPAADAELILLAFNLLKELGVSSALQINSIGCPACREAYKNALLEYYRPHRKNLCEDCKRRLIKNPLRLLDCKEPTCQPIKEGAPHIADFLDEECKKHFMQVLEILDELEISYNLNPHLVRGMDYYTRTVFEFWPAGAEKGQSSLISGGRYDNLVEELGGSSTPAVGFGAGLERIILRIKEEGAAMPEEAAVDIFVAHLGLEPRKKAIALFEDLRKAGFRVAENFSKDSLKQQLDLANKTKAKFALILGQKEMREKAVLLRDMDAGTQETVDLKKIQDVLRRRLEAEKMAETVKEGEA